MVWCIDRGVAESVPHQGVAHVEVALSMRQRSIESPQLQPALLEAVATEVTRKASDIEELKEFWTKVGSKYLSLSVTSYQNLGATVWKLKYNAGKVALGRWWIGEWIDRWVVTSRVGMFWARQKCLSKCSAVCILSKCSAVCIYCIVRVQWVQNVVTCSKLHMYSSTMKVIKMWNASIKVLKMWNVSCLSLYQGDKAVKCIIPIKVIKVWNVSIIIKVIKMWNVLNLSRW